MTVGTQEAQRPGGVGIVDGSRPRWYATRAGRRDLEVRRRPPRGARVVRPVRAPVAACRVDRSRVRLRVWVAAAVAVFAVVAASGLAIAQLAGGIAQDVPQRTAVVAVSGGESLWDVAARYAPGSDRAAVVERIEELNDVDAGAVDSGAALLVPVADEVATAG